MRQYWIIFFKIESNNRFIAIDITSLIVAQCDESSMWEQNLRTKQTIAGWENLTFSRVILNFERLQKIINFNIFRGIWVTDTTYSIQRFHFKKIFNCPSKIVLTSFKNTIFKPLSSKYKRTQMSTSSVRFDFSVQGGTIKISWPSNQISLSIYTSSLSLFNIK